MADLSIAAGLALCQEASYQARRPQRAETDAELAARGCMLHTRMRPGTIILEGGAILDDDLDGYLVIEQVPVLILSEGERDTTSDLFGRELTAYRARNVLDGREGRLTYGPGGVVRTEPQLPWLPLAAEYAEHLAQLASWESDGGN